MESIQKPIVREKIAQEFTYCPHCGRKGLYLLHGKYCRCRYCGVYRILLRESDFLEMRAPVSAAAKRSNGL